MPLLFFERHLSPAYADSEFYGHVIPGLRSLRSLARGYNHDAAPRLLEGNRFSAFVCR